MASASSHNTRTLLFTSLDVSEHLVELDLVHNGSLGCLWVWNLSMKLRIKLDDSLRVGSSSLWALAAAAALARADNQLSDAQPNKQLTNKLLINVLVHEHTRAGNAALTIVEEQANIGCRHCLIQICVIKHNQWTLAAELKCQTLQASLAAKLNIRS